MYSYVAMNACFILVAAIFIRIIGSPLNKQAIARSAALLTVCMLVFNTYLTALPIVRYSSERILGLRIGSIPIEDFAYLAVALFLVPSLFVALANKTRHKP
jgi:lycopene cyclase domain-containing protein